MTGRGALLEVDGTPVPAGVLGVIGRLIEGKGEAMATAESKAEARPNELDWLRAYYGRTVQCKGEDCILREAWADKGRVIVRLTPGIGSLTVPASECTVRTTLLEAAERDAPHVPPPASNGGPSQWGGKRVRVAGDPQLTGTYVVEKVEMQGGEWLLGFRTSSTYVCWAPASRCSVVVEEPPPSYDLTAGKWRSEPLTPADVTTLAEARATAARATAPWAGWIGRRVKCDDHPLAGKTWCVLGARVRWGEVVLLLGPGPRGLTYEALAANCRLCGEATANEAAEVAVVPPIVAGDVVRLKSGGPAMTVEAIDVERDRQLATCSWFERLVVFEQTMTWKRERVTLPVVALMRVGEGAAG